MYYIMCVYTCILKKKGNINSFDSAVFFGELDSMYVLNSILFDSVTYAYIDECVLGYRVMCVCRLYTYVVYFDRRQCM